MNSAPSRSRRARATRSARGTVNIVVLLIFRHSPPPLDALFANASQQGWKRRKAVVTDESDIPGGVVHDLPADLSDALSHDAEALATWQDITPLARNEWICWIESAKKEETRRKRILWGRSSLSDGKRRPCCWPGCPHRGATP